MNGEEWGVSERQTDRQTDRQRVALREGERMARERQTEREREAGREGEGGGRERGAVEGQTDQQTETECTEYIFYTSVVKTKNNNNSPWKAVMPNIWDILSQLVALI